MITLGNVSRSIESMTPEAIETMYGTLERSCGGGWRKVAAELNAIGIEAVAVKKIKNRDGWWFFPLTSMMPRLGTVTRNRVYRSLSELTREWTFEFGGRAWALRRAGGRYWNPNGSQPGRDRYHHHGREIQPAARVYFGDALYFDLVKSEWGKSAEDEACIEEIEEKISVMKTAIPSQCWEENVLANMVERGHGAESWADWEATRRTRNPTPESIAAAIRQYEEAQLKRKTPDISGAGPRFWWGRG